MKINFKEKALENNVLAKVNGKEITKEQLDSIMRNLPPEQAKQAASEEGRKMLLEEIISAELLYLNAIEAGMDKKDDFLTLMEDAKKSLLQRYAVEDLIAGITTDEEEIMEYYNNNHSQFQKGAEVSARHILVNDENEIKSIREEIVNGLDFSEAALKYSTCPSKNSGGNLGSFEKGRMVPEFEEAAFNMPIGDISKPVKTQFGYHLIVVDNKKEAVIADFSEVKDSIKSQIINQKQFSVYNEKLKELREKYTIEVL
jgi:peptidyl-prolyl cis-trans isomerase C